MVIDDPLEIVDRARWEAKSMTRDFPVRISVHTVEHVGSIHGLLFAYYQVLGQWMLFLRLSWIIVFLCLSILVYVSRIVTVLPMLSRMTRSWALHRNFSTGNDEPDSSLVLRRED